MHSNSSLDTLNYLFLCCIDLGVADNVLNKGPSASGPVLSAACSSTPVACSSAPVLSAACSSAPVACSSAPVAYSSAPVLSAACSSGTTTSKQPIVLSKEQLRTFLVSNPSLLLKKISHC